MNRYYTIHMLKSAKFNDFLEIHRHLHVCVCGNLSITTVKFKYFQCPKRQLLSVSRDSLSPTVFRSKASTPESMIFLCWLSYISGIKQRAVFCEWLRAYHVSQAHFILQYVNYIAVFTFSWTLYLHFLSVHYSLPQWARELQIKLWSPGSEKMAWFC